MATGPNTGIDVIGPGREDMFLENHNPVFRSADISVATPDPSTRSARSGQVSAKVRRRRIMETVSFISVEDDPPDLILSFAVWQPDSDDIRSLILMRTPKYEIFLDETERGIKVSDEAWLNDEDDMLKRIEFGDDFVRIITHHHQFELDLRKVEKEEIAQAKTLLEKMNFDNCFEMIIV